MARVAIPWVRPTSGPAGKGVPSSVADATRPGGEASSDEAGEWADVVEVAVAGVEGRQERDGAVAIGEGLMGVAPRDKGEEGVGGASRREDGEWSLGSLPEGRGKETDVDVDENGK
ncbi:hypothetical protein Dimus_020622, partial [Dionaea muscipula]